MRLQDKGWFKYDAKSKEIVQVAPHIEVVRKKRNMSDKKVTVDISLEGELITTVSMAILTERKIEVLSEFGVPITPENRHDLSTALSNQAHALDEELLYDKVGLHTYMDKPVFMGAELISKDTTLKGTLSDDSPLKLGPSGDIDSWMNMFTQHVKGHKYLELAVAIGISGLITAFLTQQKVDVFNPFVNIYGDSSIGKTTMALLAISVAGSPNKADGLYRDWNATENAVIGSLADNHGIPVLFDELSMATDLKFNRLTYSLVEGVEKSRATVTGALREQRLWNTTIISTGEIELEDLKNAANNTGAKVRYLQLTGQFTSSAKQSEEIKAVCTRNYGHILPLVAKKLLALQPEEVISRFEKLVDKYNSTLYTTSNVVQRIIKQYAILSLSALIFNETFDEAKIDLDAVFDLMVEIEKSSASERNLHEMAYDAVMQYLIANQNKIVNDRESFSRSMSLIGFCERDDETMYIRLLKSEFEKIMRLNEIEGTQKTIKAMTEHGLIIRAGTDRTAEQLTVKDPDSGTSSRNAFYKIKVDAADKAHFLFNDPKQPDNEEFSPLFGNIKSKPSGHKALFDLPELKNDDDLDFDKEIT